MKQRQLPKQRQSAEAAAAAKAAATGEKMRLDDAGRAGLPMVDLEHPRAFGLSEIPL